MNTALMMKSAQLQMEKWIFDFKKGNHPSQKAMSMARDELIDLGFTRYRASRIVTLLKLKIDEEAFENEQFPATLKMFCKLIKTHYEWFDQEGFGNFDDYLNYLKDTDNFFLQF